MHTPTVRTGESLPAILVEGCGLSPTQISVRFCLTLRERPRALGQSVAPGRGSIASIETCAYIARIVTKSEELRFPSQGVGLGQGGLISVGMGDAEIGGMTSGGECVSRPGVNMMKGRGKA